MAQIVDVHAHFVPADFPPMASRCGGDRWPVMHTTPTGGDVIIDGKLFRSVPSSCWDQAERAAEMARAGVVHQVLSPMPELFSYWSEPADARDFGRSINEGIAELVRASPALFSGLGTIPMQDPDMAAEELHRIKDLGLVGVEIGSNVRGTPPGATAHEGVLSEAARLGLVVFVHAFRADTARLVGPQILANLVGFPSEIALAAASVITSGTLDRIPDLHIAFSHGGGGFPALLGRLDNGWELFDEVRSAMLTRPRDAARRLWFDSLTYDPDALEHLIRAVGSDQIMCGSDYPFVVAEWPPGHLSVPASISADERAAISGLNARRFLDRT